MLSISVMSIGQDNYYLLLAQEGYYMKGGEPLGIWYGSGAAELKLQGTVTAQALHALMLGYSLDGKALVRNAVKNLRKQKVDADFEEKRENATRARKRGDKKERKKKKKVRDPGWDLTFSAPKSVSVLWSQANLRLRKIIETCIEQAFRKAVDYLEQEAAYCRIGRGGAEKVKAKLTVAAFVHGTSRKIDPQYHIHGLFMNAGLCPDGNYRALSSIDLFRHKMAAGAFFRAALAHLLQEELGVKIVRPMNKKGDLESWFEIDGVSESLRNEFSKRREEIKEALGKLGLESAAAAAIATLDTRKKKGTIPPREELFKMWREEGRKHGFTQANIEKLLGRIKKSNPRLQSRRYEKALQEAVAVLTRSEGHFTELELLRRTFEAAQGWGVEPEFVMKSVRRDLGNPKKFIELGKVAGVTRYTTPAIMALEKVLIDAVDVLHHSEFRPVDAEIVESIIANPLFPQAKSMMDKLKAKAGKGGKPVILSEEQAKALRYLTGGEGRIKILNGLAGTGKTTLLSAMEEAYRRQGYEVVGCSVAGVAAQGLQTGAGIESDTVAMRMKQLSPDLAWTFKHHAKQLYRAVRKKRTYGINRLKIDRRTVLVVDEAGMLGTEEFATLAKAVQKGGGIMVCVGDHRQLPSISAGGGFEYVAHRVGQVDLQDIGRQTDHIQREIVKALVAGDAKLALNLFAECGQLKISASQEKTTERLIEDWKNSGGVDKPKDHVIVVATNREVQTYNDLVQRELAQAGKLDLSQPVKVREETVYPGDRILFTEKSRRLGIENGDRGVLVGVKDWGVGVTVAVRLDRNEQTILLPMHRVMGKSYQDFQRGYAFTTHKLQGATVDHSYIHVGGRMTTKEMAYVQCSRNRESIRLYTEKLEAGKELTRIAREHSKRRLHREGEQKRQENHQRKLGEKQRYEQSQRKELIETRLPTVNRVREKENSLEAQRELPKSVEWNRENIREETRELVREHQSEGVQESCIEIIEKPHSEYQVKQEPSREPSQPIVHEVIHQPEQLTTRGCKEEYKQVPDLSQAMLPEIGRDKLPESLRLERKQEIDHTQKQEAKASYEVAGENRAAREQRPSRDHTPQPAQERQVEIGQLPRQNVKVEHDRLREVSQRTEPKPVPEKSAKVEQEVKREAERQPYRERREAYHAVQDLSRAELPEINLKKYSEILQAEKQDRKKEIEPTRMQNAIKSYDIAGANRAGMEQKPLRDHSPQPEQERKPEILQASGQEPKAGQKFVLTNVKRVKREHKLELVQSQMQDLKPEQEHVREKLSRLDRETRQEPLMSPKRVKKVEQEVLQEKLPKTDREKRLESRQPPKQEKDVSPLIKQMSESRAKKLAHEILAEAQQLKRQQEQSQTSAIGR